MSNKKRGLKREDLEIGEVYYCRLSSKEMIITGVDEVDSTKGGKTKLVYARYFNTVTGVFEQTTVVDHQMEELF